LEIISVLIAILINLVNLVFSIKYMNRIMRQNWKDFMKKFYLMMAIRFIIILGIFFVLIKIIKMDELYLSLTFILSYFVVIIIEILYLNKRYSILNFKQPKK